MHVSKTLELPFNESYLLGWYSVLHHSRHQIVHFECEGFGDICYITNSSMLITPVWNRSHFFFLADLDSVEVAEVRIRYRCEGR